MPGVLEVNNAAGGGLIMPGTMGAATTLRVREGGSRRAAADGKLGAIEIKAGMGGVGELHVGNSFSAESSEL